MLIFSQSLLVLRGGYILGVSASCASGWLWRVHILGVSDSVLGFGGLGWLVCGGLSWNRETGVSSRLSWGSLGLRQIPVGVPCGLPGLFRWSSAGGGGGREEAPVLPQSLIL